MTNCLGGIQAFGTHVDAVLNTVATEHAEGVIQLGQTVFGRGITTVGEESVRLQQTGRTDKAVGVPPEGGTTGRATGTENALIQAIQLRTFLRRLQAFDRRRRRGVLKVGLYFLVLGVKKAHVHDKIPNHGQSRQRTNHQLIAFDTL